MSTFPSCWNCGNTTYGNQTNNASEDYDLVCVFEDYEENFLSSITFQTSVCVMYSIIFLAALLGNGIVCFVVRGSPSMKTPTNYFIVNLAVGDILMTLFCVPFSFVPMLLLRYWPFGGVMCKVVNYSQAVSVLVSAYTLLAISLDRYNVIMHPLKPRLGTLATKFVVASVWLGAMFTAAPIAIVSRLQKPSLWHQACKVDICAEQWGNPDQSKQYTYALLLLQFALPLSALVCTYARIAHLVWGGRPPGEAQDARDARLRLAKWKMIKMMVIIVAVFTICWLPLNIFIILWTYHEDDVEWSRWPGLPYFWFGCHWLAMSHSCYNPIIYCYMNNKYRRGFQEVFEAAQCLRTKRTNRPFPRSSICDGVQLDEFARVNGPAVQRSCMCHMHCASKPSTQCSRCRSSEFVARIPLAPDNT